MPAVALTDHGNMFGAVEFYKACKDAKIKPILGCEMYVAPTSRFDKTKGRGDRVAFHLTLLAKNNVGYHNLCKLSSIGYVDGFYYHPRVDLETLEKYAEGLICLSGCLSSRLSYEILHGNAESILETIEWHRKVFGEDFYFELMRHPMSDDNIRRDGIDQETWLQRQYEDYINQQEKVNQALIKLGSN